MTVKMSNKAEMSSPDDCSKGSRLQMKVDAQDPLVARFKSALSAFPSGVVVATMQAADGTRAGFTASAFSSLSMDPPLVLVCLARTARCHDYFLQSRHFAINVLRPEQEDIAKRFASSTDDKFAGLHVNAGPFDLPLIANSAASLVCATENTIPGGDHTILIGRVLDAESVETVEPMVYFRRRFWRLAEHQAMQGA